MLVLTSGCMKWTAIRPEHLPMLNGSDAVDLGQQGNYRVVAVTSRTVERPDGRTVQIRGRFDARLTGHNGRQIVVRHPVVAAQEGPVLHVRGSNLAAPPIPLQNLRTVEVGQRNGAAIALGAGLGGAVVGALIGLLVIKRL
ncbi:MAG: hypothetical protein KC586_15230 [Myxococcales bacterium]|nr:hypothetical protein [Myxococcales bacterium]